MEIRLNRLTLGNFKGVKNFTLEPAGENCVVRGDNGAGKTTLQDAFLWLLFNKNSEGRSDFAVKTLDADGSELHNLEHSVEADLGIDDKSIVLRKVYKEKYTKKRGSPIADFTGHTTDYYINGVPVQKKEWDEQLKGIIDENSFRLLTSPTYFNDLPWQKRRGILLSVCGDVTDADVIKSDKALAELPEILGQRTLEEHKKVVLAKKREINDRLKQIPARIDELNMSIASSSKSDPKQIAARIKDLEAQIQAAKDNTAISTLRQKKAELSADLAELTGKRNVEATKATKDIDELDAEITKQIRLCRNIVEEAESTEQRLKNAIERNEKNMAFLREEFARIAGVRADVEDTCPTCGQTLPKDQIKAAIEKHKERQAREFAEINKKGKELKQENQTHQTKIAEVQKKKSDTEKMLHAAEKDLKALPAKRDVTTKKATSEIDKLIKAKEAEIAEIENRIAENIPQDTGDLENELAVQQSYLAEIKAAKRSEERIKELSLEEKDLAMEFERLEKETFLMEKFVVQKVNLLSDKINSRFGIVRFKLFEEQINGGITETCVTLVNGIPAGYGLNTGAEINAGLDIIRTLSDFYKTKAPVFIDHAESVTEILDPETQTIKLVVDADYPELEVIYG
jgi:DNA repair exonuclease SbcCD ATPase subunit